MKISELKAREIKDSRGNLTVEVELKAGNSSFSASVPSGASTGKNEAAVLPVSVAIENINKIIAPKLKGNNPENQEEIDNLMIRLDGTKDKSKLGANAILPVSIAVSRAGAASKKLPLYLHIREISSFKLQDSSFKLPLPSFNLIEGGAHTVGRNKLDFQEFMAVPQKKSFKENLILANQVFKNLEHLIKKNFKGGILIGDEGGFAPPILKIEQALFLLKEAIGNLEVKIIIDSAASQFYKDGKYEVEGKSLTRSQMVELYKDLVSRFPIIAVEDPFAEEDFEGFKDIMSRFNRGSSTDLLSGQQISGVFIIGDDLTTTNAAMIKTAHSKNACNGVIIKPNQIGTVTETVEAVRLVKSYGWKIMVSHRSGETIDTFIADLSVGVGADFIKSGAPTQEERMVKYSRLLEIEQELSKKIK